MDKTSIRHIVEKLSEKVATLEQYLNDECLPGHSFDVDAPRNLGIAAKATDIEQARRSAVELSLELHDLLAGPAALLRPNINATSLQFIYRYKIPFKIPLHGRVSFAELAEQCKLPELDVLRMLRFAMVSHRVFCEPEEGLVAHTAASRLLLDDEREWDMAGLLWDEDWPAFARTLDSIQQWGDSEPNHTGHNLAFQTTDSFFEWLKEKPMEYKRFYNAISLYAAPGPSLEHLSTVFPWKNLPQGSNVVDVGGGDGRVSIYLAEKYPQLSFIVQDLPDAIAGKDKEVPDRLKGRIEFMEHDFFKEQSSAGEVYLLRAVLHNWPDHYCHKVLRQLRPALKQGSRIVIQDGILPAFKTMNLLAERNLRGFDMLMMTLLNAREREESDWQKLFADADRRFVLKDIYKSPTGSMSVLVIEWIGQTDTT